VIRLGYCLGVKSVVSIKETIMYQLEASKKNPKSSQSLQERATNRFFVLSLDLPYHCSSCMRRLKLNTYEYQKKMSITLESA